MTDETTPPDVEQPAGSVSPAAQAARRARRIGGRPVGSVSGAAAPEAPAAPSPPMVSTSKAATRPPAAVVPSGPPVPPAWLNWTPAGVLSLGALVMAVLLVVFSHGVWWGPDPARTPAGGDRLREEVLAAAKTCTAATQTYKYTDLDSFESKALACSTGVFAQQFKQYIDAVLKRDAAKLKASQTAQINRGGIEAVTKDGKQWTLLLFGQLAVTNTSYPKGRVDPFAAQVRMERHHGHWVISGLSSVSSPGV